MIAAALVLIAVGGLASVFMARLRQVQREESPTITDEQAATLSPIVARPPATQGFVGSAACAECHAEIAQKYAGHPMANSLKTVAEASKLEDYTRASFSPPGPRRYRAEQTPEGLRHYESMVDLAGEKIYEQEASIEYVLGSGQHGRSYVLEKDGRLFQSSIGWFAEGGTWALSPGYRPDAHQRFERRMGDGCLYCHSGRVLHQAANPDLYEKPPFAEAIIGCERCHGPGEAHVAHQRAAKTEGPDPTIVNPGRLEPSKREAVCNQCHLQGEKVIPRLGRGFFDFRPGEYLDDSLLVLVHGQRVDDQRRTRPVSQVEQMRSSKCFVESRGQMGCISCHDPHEDVPAAQHDVYYRQRCLQCHQEQGCSAPEAERRKQSPEDACAQCHMPALKTKDVAHTSLTDHRILRVPETSSTTSRLPNADEIELFDGAELRVSKREADRARAIAMIDIAASRGDKTWAARGEEFLVPNELVNAPLSVIWASFGDDYMGIEYLGQAFMLQDRRDEAIACWQYVFQKAPRTESVCIRLADVYQDAEEYKEALEFLDRALALNPTISLLHARRTYVLGKMGRFDEGIQSAQRALAGDPTLLQVREWLVETYGRLGRKEEQQAELEKARRMHQVVREKKS